MNNRVPRVSSATMQPSIQVVHTGLKTNVHTRCRWWPDCMTMRISVSLSKRSEMVRQMFSVHTQAWCTAMRISDHMRLPATSGLQILYDRCSTETETIAEGQCNAYHLQDSYTYDKILSYGHLFQVLKGRFLSVFCRRSNQITCLTCPQPLLHFCTTLCLGATQIWR